VEIDPSNAPSTVVDHVAGSGTSALTLDFKLPDTLGHIKMKKRPTALSVVPVTADSGIPSTITEERWLIPVPPGFAELLLTPQ
jgi:hypothetical protein